MSKAWKDANREKVRAAGRAYYYMHKAKMLAYGQKWREKNRERQRETERKRRAKNHDAALKRDAHYRKKYGKLLVERVMRYYYRNRDKILARRKLPAVAEVYRRNNKKLYAKNVIKIRAQQREWRARNKEKLAAYNKKHKLRRRAKIYAENNSRMAKLKTATVDVESVAAFYEFVRTQLRIKCAYCGVMVEGCKAHIDHIVPVSRGGLHSVDNLCAACPRCNLSKRDKLVSEWKPLISMQERIGV